MMFRWPCVDDPLQCYGKHPGEHFPDCTGQSGISSGVLKEPNKVSSLSPVWHDQAQTCSTGILNSPNLHLFHLVFLFYLLKFSSFTTPIPFQINSRTSVYHLPTGHGLADFITLFGVYNLIALVISTLFSSSAKLLLSFFFFFFYLWLPDVSYVLSC